MVLASRPPQPQPALQATNHVAPSSTSQVEGEGWSDCARRGLAVKAVKGAALMFYSLKPNGEVDPASTHGSCPTTAGEKWSATRWIHVGPFQPPGTKHRAGCVDDHDKCEEWAVMGECECPALLPPCCRCSVAACSVAACAATPANANACGAARQQPGSSLAAAPARWLAGDTRWRRPPPLPAVATCCCPAGEKNPAFMHNACKQSCKKC